MDWCTVGPLTVRHAAKLARLQKAHGADSWLGQGIIKIVEVEGSTS